MNPRRTIAALLCLVFMVILALPSCGAGGAATNDTTAGDNGGISSTEATTEAGRAGTSDSLPAGLDFKGEKYTILSRVDLTFGTEMGVEEENGDVVNDAIYRRNKSVEDRLNVKIDVVKIPGIWGNEAAFNNTVTKSVAAGDNLYDLIAGYAYFITPLAATGNFLNIKNLPYVDYTKPWWSLDLAQKMTVDNKLYFMTGDLSLSMIQSYMVIYFNKQLAKDYAVEDLYQTVLDGNWTMDKLAETSRGIYKDLNGNSVKDKEDLYGSIFETGNYVDGFMVCQDNPVTSIGDDGLPQLVLNSPRTIDSFDKVYQMLFNNPGGLWQKEEGERPTLKMFINDQCLFNVGMLSLTEMMRDMKSDYGILPFPKHNDQQAKYLTFAQDAYSLFSIPATNDRLELVGAVTEALAAESYRYVTPAYYDTALKVKYSRDDVTGQMLDIINAGLIFDFAFVNSNSMDGIMHIFRTLVDSKKADFVSAYEKSEVKYQTSLTKLIDAYKGLA